MILKLWGVSFYFSKVEFFCFIKKHILHLKNPQFTFYTKKSTIFPSFFFSTQKKLQNKNQHKENSLLLLAFGGTEVHI